MYCNYWGGGGGLALALTPNSFWDSSGQGNRKKIMLVHGWFKGLKGDS